MSAYASSGISNSSEAPVISAAPSAMCRTFSTSSFIAASVAARTKNSACAKWGTTFGTSPPWVMIPWMRASAVMLAQGIDPVEDLDDRVQRVDAVEGIGCRVRRSPVKADLDQHAGQRLTAPLDRRTGRLEVPGWAPNAASTPANTPPWP